MERITLVDRKQVNSKGKEYFVLVCYNSLGFIFRSFVNKDFFETVQIGEDITDYTYRRYNTTKNIVEYYIKYSN